MRRLHYPTCLEFTARVRAAVPGGMEGGAQGFSPSSRSWPPLRVLPRELPLGASKGVSCLTFEGDKDGLHPAEQRAQPSRFDMMSPTCKFPFPKGPATETPRALRAFTCPSTMPGGWRSW